MTRYENAEKNLSQEPASNGSYFMKFTVSPSKYGGRDEQCSVFIDRYGKIRSFQCAGYNTDWMLDERIVIDTGGMPESGGGEACAGIQGHGVQNRMVRRAGEQPARG